MLLYRKIKSMKRFVILIIAAIACGYLISLFFGVEQVRQPHKEAVHKTKLNTLIKSEKIKKKTVRRNTTPVEKLLESKEEIKLRSLKPCELVKYLKYSQSDHLEFLEASELDFYKNLPKDKYKITNEKEYDFLSHSLDFIDDGGIFLADIIRNFDQYIITNQKYKTPLMARLLNKYESIMHMYPLDRLALLKEKNRALDKLGPDNFPFAMDEDEKFRSSYTTSVKNLISKTKDFTEMIIAINYLKKFKRPDYFYLKDFRDSLVDNQAEKDQITTKIIKNYIQYLEEQDSLIFIDEKNAQMMIQFTGKELGIKITRSLTSLASKYNNTPHSCDDRDYIRLCEQYCSK